jgi:hypothetical protein
MPPPPQTRKIQGVCRGLTGLLAACPTTVVYFFGDQPFWGGACARAGVGPQPIPISALTVKKLVDAFVTMREPSVRQTAKAISERLQKVCGERDAAYPNGGFGSAVCARWPFCYTT